MYHWPTNFTIVQAHNSEITSLIQHESDYVLMHCWNALSQETYTLWNSSGLLQTVFMQRQWWLMQDVVCA